MAGARVGHAILGAWALAACSSPSSLPGTPDAAAVDASPSAADADLAIDAPPADGAPPAIDAAVIDVVVIPVQVITSHPHDRSAFTEGLLYSGGFLYESTGLYGSSTLRRVDPETGDVVQSVDLDPQYFGEGIALVGESIIQLTYQEQVAFVHDLQTFATSSTYSYTGQGWGLCHDGTVLYMSDGSSDLTIRDPSTFAIVGTLPVRAAGAPVVDLNELECVGDDILANVWLTRKIVRIQKATGAITAVYDASALPEARMANPDAVLNGIAYFPDDDSFFITGKLWPTLYEVTLPLP